MECLNDIIAKEIKKRRVSKRWTKKELAQQLGSPTPGCVWSWESGRNAPTAYYLCQLADVFDCSVDSLLGRDADA